MHQIRKSRQKFCQTRFARNGWMPHLLLQQQPHSSTSRYKTHLLIAGDNFAAWIEICSDRTNTIRHAELLCTVGLCQMTSLANSATCSKINLYHSTANQLWSCLHCRSTYFHDPHSCMNVTETATFSKHIKTEQMSKPLYMPLWYFVIINILMFNTTSLEMLYIPVLQVWQSTSTNAHCNYKYKLDTVRVSRSVNYIYKVKKDAKH